MRCCGERVHNCQASPYPPYAAGGVLQAWPDLARRTKVRNRFPRKLAKGHTRDTRHEHEVGLETTQVRRKYTSGFDRISKRLEPEFCARKNDCKKKRIHEQHCPLPCRQSRKWRIPAKQEVGSARAVECQPGDERHGRSRHGCDNHDKRQQVSEKTGRSGHVGLRVKPMRHEKLAGRC